MNLAVTVIEITGIPHTPESGALRGKGATERCGPYSSKVKTQNFLSGHQTFTALLIRVPLIHQWAPVLRHVLVD